jgi:hypothetical protein
MDEEVIVVQIAVAPSLFSPIVTRTDLAAVGTRRRPVPFNLNIHPPPFQIQERIRDRPRGLDAHHALEKVSGKHDEHFLRLGKKTPAAAS